MADSEKELRDGLIKLAYDNPDIREDILPLLSGKEAGLEKTAGRVPRSLQPVADAIEKKMNSLIAGQERYEAGSRQETGVGGIQYDEGRDERMAEYDDLINRLDRALYELTKQDRAYSHVRHAADRRARKP